MKTSKSMHAALGSALLLGAPAACGPGAPNPTSTTFASNTFPPGSDDSDPTNNPTTDGPTTDNPTTNNPTTNNPTTNDPTTNDPTTNNPTTVTDSTTTNPSTTTEPLTTTTDPGTDGTSGALGFDFADDPYDAYAQLDRHGAVEAGTAGIRAADGLGFNMGADIAIRDPYNASNPEEDAAGMWIPEIVNSVTFFHGALDDDLLALGLTPATLDETVAQVGPVIVPDTIKYDLSMPTNFPNGRRLEDPVIDITLAALLLKLGPQQPVTLFADLPLNPPANDVPFQNEFPFLAPPHAP